MYVEDEDIKTLLLVRQWLDSVLQEIGIHSANEFNKMAAKIRKDVDKELWKRIVSKERSPYECL